jgi:hypothetical protein
MKYVYLTGFYCIGILGASAKGTAGTNPLAIFHGMWENEQYTYCNTAKNARFLTPLEKDVVYVLNLVRQFPKAFNKTVVAYWPEYMGDKNLPKSWYYKTLVTALDNMKPVGILKADSLAWISARCHAITSGKAGYLGHVRQTAPCEKQEHYFGECCQYGYEDALEIIMSLLIDEGIKDLGHRKICLSDGYTSIGVSFQPHKTYRFNTVLDFGRN